MTKSLRCVKLLLRMTLRHKTPPPKRKQQGEEERPQANLRIDKIDRNQEEQRDCLENIEKNVEEGRDRLGSIENSLRDVSNVLKRLAKHQMDTKEE